METYSASLAFCVGNSPVPGEFPAQRPVTWNFDVFFDLRPNKLLSKHSWGWWLGRSRAHYDVNVMFEVRNVPFDGLTPFCVWSTAGTVMTDYELRTIIPTS